MKNIWKSQNPLTQWLTNGNKTQEPLNGLKSGSWFFPLENGFFCFDVDALQVFRTVNKNPLQSVIELLCFVATE